MDSSVLAVLLHKAIGNRLVSIFVDNGLLRQGEAQEVVATFRDAFHLNFRIVHARERFLEKLEGIVDPEQKRKIIGNEFIQVFDEEAKSSGRSNSWPRGRYIPTLSKALLPSADLPPSSKATTTWGGFRKN